MLEPLKLALVTNEPTFRWVVAQSFMDRGYSVDLLDRGPGAVDAIRESRPSAILIEAAYGSAISATGVVEGIRRDPRLRYTPIVVCSPDQRFLASYGEYLRGQACIVLGKPFDAERFGDVVEQAVDTNLSHAVSALNAPAHYAW